MTAASILFVIAAAVAALSLTTAAIIWSAHPVDAPAASCGTLREPANPVVLTRAGAPLVADDPAPEIEAALAEQRCDRARDQVAFAHRTALAAGGMAGVTAIGALVAGRREEAHLRAELAVHEHRLEASGGLDGHAVPGRHDPFHEACAARGLREPGRLGDARG